MIFMCHKIWFFAIVSNRLRMYKTILSSWIGQKLAEDWRKPISKENIQVANRNVKAAKQHESLGECRAKLQQDITSHLLE